MPVLSDTAEICWFQMTLVTPFFYSANKWEKVDYFKTSHISVHPLRNRTSEARVFFLQNFNILSFPYQDLF